MVASEIEGAAEAQFPNLFAADGDGGGGEFVQHAAGFHESGFGGYLGQLRRGPDFALPEFHGRHGPAFPIGDRQQVISHQCVQFAQLRFNGAPDFVGVPRRGRFARQTDGRLQPGVFRQYCRELADSAGTLSVRPRDQFF